jgi:hypothetical protein
MFVTGTAGALTLPATVNDDILGVISEDGALPNNPPKLFNKLDLPYYPVGRAINLLTKGRVWVPVGEDVDAGDAVLIRFTAIDNAPKGIAVKTAVTGSDPAFTIALTGAKFISDTVEIPTAATHPVANGLTWAVTQTISKLKIALVEL